MTEYMEIKSNNRTLRGMGHYLCRHEQNRVPVVIVHGYFSANRVGPQRLFYEMAEQIVNNRFEAYRFDLSGMGESDGIIEEITFFDHVNDLIQILDFVRKKHALTRVCVIAHCLGCNITLATVKDYASWFREIIFLAPYYTNDDVLKSFFSSKAIEQLQLFDYTYRKGLYAHSSFFKASEQKEFVESLLNTPVFLNVVLPTHDQYIPQECNKSVFGDINKLNVVWIEGADHNFLETKKKVIETVIEVLKDDRYTT